MSDAIFIAGYYRSGTSALAGALARLGVTLHNDAEPNEHNPLGFYEIPELIEFDVAMFTHLGIDWTDLRGLPPGWSERADIAPHLSRLDEILRRRFAHEKLWALKHPHLCRLFPLYERAAKQAGHRLHAIHITRDPWSVAASQHTKNGLSRAHAVLLWIEYLIAAERNARHLPRSWMTYQSLLKNPSATLKQIETDLSLDLCNNLPGGLIAATDSLTVSLNRAKPTPDATLLAPVRELATRLWDAVQSPAPATADWDGFAKDFAEINNFLNEINESGGRPFPGFGAQAAAEPAAITTLRPPERLDDGAKQRLRALRNAAGALPSLTIFIAAPPNRAHAISETLASLQAQWQTPDAVIIIAADPVELPTQTIIPCGADAGALTQTLCAEINQTSTTDYIAILNAGDTLAPDACLRFALTAASANAPDMIYCDEIVPADKADWVRYKPGWDITRLRQAAYIGDWVWYRSATIAKIGGFDAARAGAEEYDIQLRLAEANANVVRLAETLFTRARHSRRDNIPSTIFGARAASAITAHLTRAGIPATVQPRQHLGLFRHERTAPDPGTSILLLCDHADIAMLDHWLKSLLAGPELTGPIILAGTEMPPETVNYLAEINARATQLDGKIIAIPATPGGTEADTLRSACAALTTPLTAIIAANSQPADPAWQAALRACLADPAIAIAAARTLVPLTRDNTQFSVQGPIIPGADTRLGAGHLSNDPGPGGWLAVDQEATAIAPACLLRTAALAALTFNNLTGDALWIDLCVQIAQTGQRILWTPDVSFITANPHISPDFEAAFRTGSPAATALPWADPYHHPALSLRGDLLSPEQRLGLIRAAPADLQSLLLSGPAEAGAAILNAARALRGAGILEANWVGDHMLAAELGRRAPSPWVRINPVTAPPLSYPYAAVFTAAPMPAAKPALAAASQLYATSPGLVARVKKSIPPGRRVSLWRPALSAAVWQNFTRNTGINTLPRILWVDEAATPVWWPDLIAQTQNSLAWIIVERRGMHFNGAFARLAPPLDEQGWAVELAALAPQIFVRPAGADADADHYVTLIAAAAGCDLILDDRLDTPPNLHAKRLPNRISAWQKALEQAIAGLSDTLARGQQNQSLAQALPSLESAPPPWSTPTTPHPQIRAAE